MFPIIASFVAAPAGLAPVAAFFSSSTNIDEPISTSVPKKLAISPIMFARLSRMSRRLCAGGAERRAAAAAAPSIAAAAAAGGAGVAELLLQPRGGGDDARREAREQRPHLRRELVGADRQADDRRVRVRRDRRHAW